MTLNQWLRRALFVKAPQSRRRVRVEVELLEDRCVPTVTGFRPIDEVGNNVANPTWGTAGTDLLRLTPAAYADGVSAPSLPQDPSARLISNIVNTQADPSNPSQDLNTVNGLSLSDFAYTFGQFMDHDMDLSQDGTTADNIAVPAGDPIGGGSDSPLYFNRSQTDPNTGTGAGNPAQQTNSITSYLDLSQVYGSDLATSNALRTMSGGQMKTSPGGLPPLYNSTYFTPTQLAAINAAEGGMADAGFLPESSMFVTGDTRGNENAELTALQTLFLDNHNRLAAQLQKQNPTWTDEQLFQEARKLNIAEYQSIVYNEYLPALLGSNALPAYSGYNPNVNAGIANEFSTVAFRFGHSLLDNELSRDGNNGQAVAADVPLSEDFFDPSILNGRGQPSTTDPVTGLPSTAIDAILKGNADGVAQAEDVMAVDSVRNLLFNEVIPGVGGGQDLMALDVQRGRDHGIGSYNQVRVALGLPAVTSFAQITSNVQVQQRLQQAYGNVNNIDAFEGGLAEDPVPGSDVGPLFQKIMVTQFNNLRSGDRFFYLNEQLNSAEQNILQQGNTLAKVIEANTNITNLQNNVFYFRVNVSGTVFVDGNHDGVRESGEPAVAGATVQLLSGGTVVATTHTDQNGNYQFNPFNGLSLGTFQVDVLPPPNAPANALAVTSPVLTLTRGDTSLAGVNLGVPPPPQQGNPPPPQGSGGWSPSSQPTKQSSGSLTTMPTGGHGTTSSSQLTQAVFNPQGKPSGTQLT